MIKIAIVGNGYILNITNCGNEIDKCNYVVRVSPPKIMSREISGGKTDCIVFVESEYNNFKDYNCDKIMLIGDDDIEKVIDRKKEKYGENIRYFGYNYEIERKIRIVGRLSCDKPAAPTSGARAIVAIRELYKNAAISIYGFDWYKYEYAHWYDKEKEDYSSNNSIHSVKNEEIVMRDYCIKNNIYIEETPREVQKNEKNIYNYKK